MLSLGSVKLDASYVRTIQDKLKLHIWTNRDRESHDQYVSRKLHWFLQEIAATSPFYQNTEFSLPLLSLAPEQGLSQLPLLTKSRLRQMSESFIPEQGAAAYFNPQTSGSTGVPLKMWFDHEYFVSFYSRFCYFLQMNDLWPAPYSTCMVTVSPFKKAVDYSVLQPVVNYSYNHKVNMHPSHWESPAALVNSLSLKAPMILCGMPTALQLLAEHSRDYPPSRPLRPKLVISMQEALLPTTRQELEQAFGAPVFDEYGLTEVGGIIAQECREHKGFHINTLDYYAEAVDSSGTPVAEGDEGEIVITNLYNQPIPLLRYQTGDYGVIIREPCPCGSVAPRILRLAGRTLTRFTRPGAASYNPFDVFGDDLLSLPISQYQMVQEKDSQITLYYTGNQDIADHAGVQALRNRVQRLYDEQVSFRIQRVDRFTCAGKFQSFLRRE